MGYPSLHLTVCFQTIVPIVVLNAIKFLPKSSKTCPNQNHFLSPVTLSGFVTVGANRQVMSGNYPPSGFCLLNERKIFINLKARIQTGCVVMILSILFLLYPEWRTFKGLINVLLTKEGFSPIYPTSGVKLANLRHGFQFAIQPVALHLPD